MTLRWSGRSEDDGAWCASMERPHLRIGLIALGTIAAVSITASVLSLLAI